MLKFIRPRLRKPAGIALVGTFWAVAWLVHGGYGWVWAVVVAVGVACYVIRLYVWGGQDSDEGALIGSRADERQASIAQRSWALTGKAVMLAAFAGLTVAVAVGAVWWWPFAVILGVAGVTYLLGLSTYGVGEQDQADDADVGDETPSPMTR
jgi:hypothetical protein